jgi:DNA-binding winged helix-turn-helix (wHTH) protein
VLRRLRAAQNSLPVIILTARDSVADTVRGLDSGADDYMSKPFRFDELLARIRALVRRGGAERLEVLRYGAVTLDRLRHVCLVNETPLDLTAKEFQIVEFFLLHPEQVVRRTTLLEKVWDMHFDPESNVVDVHVGNAEAQKATVKPIQTVRGVGFSPPADQRRQQGVRPMSAPRNSDPRGPLPFTTSYIVTGLRFAPGHLLQAHSSGWQGYATGLPWSGELFEAADGRFAADPVATLAITAPVDQPFQACRGPYATGGEALERTQPAALRRGPRARSGAEAAPSGRRTSRPRWFGRRAPLVRPENGGLATARWGTLMSMPRAHGEPLVRVEPEPP